jgi:serine/threonine protein kinase
MLTTDQVLGKGRYRIISNFLHDETGGLYEAYDTVSNSNVVLRETVGSAGGIMTPAQLDEINNTFVGEAAALKEIRHDALLNVQDYFSEIDRHYLVMEPVDGFDLTKFFQPEEKQPALTDVMKWADQILAVLDHLHTLPEPFIHRDIRPANIRLTSNFKVKVLTSGLTSSDVIMASAGDPTDSAILNYRPLEQLWGGLDPASQKVILNSYDDRSRRILQQPLDARSDLYAVGATLYHLVTRTLPKDALDRSIELLDGNSDPLVPPAEIDPSIPEAVSEVIMKAMELKREHRYDSASIMKQVLDTAWQRSQSQRAAQPKERIAPEPLQTSEKEPQADEPRIEEVKQESPAPSVKEAKPHIADSKSESNSEPADDAFLLEVEPVKNADDDFEWSIDVSEQPAKKAAAARTPGESDLDFNLPAAPSSNMKFVMAGAGGLVLVVAILGWFLMGGSSKPSEPARTQPVETQQPVQEQVPAAAYTDQNSANTSIEAAPLINETVTVEAKPEAKPAQAKEKKPTPTPSKSEKKKVTVDDLINDN